MIRKRFLHPLYIFISFLKYGIYGAAITAEVDLIFWLFKPSGLLLAFVELAGLNIAVHFLLRRLPFKWERFEPKKLAEKILRLER
jgi:hypothetical protein